MIHTIGVQRHIYREKEFEELRSITKGFKRKEDIIEYKLPLEEVFERKLICIKKS